MKIEFFIKKGEHPLFIEYRKAATKEIFGDLNSLLNTNIHIDYTDKETYESFSTITIKNTLSLEEILNIINIFKDELSKKFKYVNKESILYKFIKE